MLFRSQAGDALLEELQAFDPAVFEAASEIADRRQKRLDQFPACVGVAAFGRDHQIPFLQSGESLLNHRPRSGGVSILPLRA